MFLAKHKSNIHFWTTYSGPTLVKPLFSFVPFMFCFGFGSASMQCCMMTLRPQSDVPYAMLHLHVRSTSRTSHNLTHPYVICLNTTRKCGTFLHSPKKITSIQNFTLYTKHIKYRPFRTFALDLYIQRTCLPSCFNVRKFLCHTTKSPSFVSFSIESLTVTVPLDFSFAFLFYTFPAHKVTF